MHWRSHFKDPTVVGCAGALCHSRGPNMKNVVNHVTCGDASLSGMDALDGVLSEPQARG